MTAFSRALVLKLVDTINDLKRASHQLRQTLDELDSYLNDATTEDTDLMLKALTLHEAVADAITEYFGG